MEDASTSSRARANMRTVRRVMVCGEEGREEKGATREGRATATSASEGKESMTLRCVCA